MLLNDLRIPHINKLIRNYKGYCLDASCLFKTQLVLKRFSHICLEKALVSKSIMTVITSVILVFKFYLVLFWEKWETRRDNRLLKKKLWRRISHDRSQRPWSDVFMYMSLFMGSLSGYHSVSSEQYSIKKIFQLFKINK